MKFADIHTHILYSVDDGAKNVDQMHLMLTRSYEDGIRILCCTPHCHPGYYGDNRAAIKQALQEARDYAATHLPGMQIYLGSELRYSENFRQWIEAGYCRTLNDSKYLLVDFSGTATAEYISGAYAQIFSLGYIPVLAHVERYQKIRGDISRLEEFKNKGGLIQLDADAVLGKCGFAEKHHCKDLLSRHLADIIASDCHDRVNRAPGLSACYRAVRARYGEEYAAGLFWKTPVTLLQNATGD